MRHLIVSRELPPAAYAVGGIGTYVVNVSRLLADAGETVHLLGERWRGAPDEHVVDSTGHLVTHRVPSAEPLVRRSRATTWAEISLLRGSAFPAQAWGWNAALLVEELVESEKIDVIEAQEWEAPLYYFLLRRALGLGPRYQPPVIIQLHSPSEFIWRYNKWPVTRPDFLPMRRQEEYCIRAADALLCPSRYLAGQAEERYQLAPNSITVIPIPIGRLPDVPRHEERTGDGPVVYVGRLEPRKGLIEFVDAATRIAGDFPHTDFEFLGADTPYHDGVSVGQYLASLIPRSLKPRFRFRGGVRRDMLAEVLAGASLAVVPSRWENFPNSCVEAMSAGVPVLVSPNGGMAEMIEDGVTGWIAASQHPADLAAGLTRALSTPPGERAAMGRAAAEAIQATCGRDVITEAQVGFRARVAQAGVVKSNRLPMTKVEEVDSVAASWTHVTLDGDGSLTNALRHAARSESIAVAAMLGDFVVEPSGIEMATRVLTRYPEIGVISGWIADNPTITSSAPPDFPYQWLANDARGVVVFRRQALERIPAVSHDIGDEEGLWDLVNAVLAQGWKGVSLPMVIGRLSVAARDPRVVAPDEPVREASEKLHYYHDAYPELFEQDRELQSLLLDVGANAADEMQRRASQRLRYPTIDRWKNLTPTELWRLPLRDKVALLNAAVRDPQRSIAWLKLHVPGARDARESSGER